MPPRNHVPPPAEPAKPEREETIEEAALRLMHPNCRPEVAIALLKGEPHPYYDADMNPRPEPAPDPRPGQSSND